MLLLVDLAEEEVLPEEFDLELELELELDLQEQTLGRGRCKGEVSGAREAEQVVGIQCILEVGV